MAGDDISIQIVDEEDQPTGAASMAKARRMGLRHRIVRVMVEDPDGNVLLQKRSAAMETWPLCWDTSAAGHVDAGETYEAAALRELKEEVGIDGVTLEETSSYESHKEYGEFKLNRFNKTYKTVVPSGTSITIDKEEVAKTKWFTHADLVQLVKEKPQDVTDGLAYAVQHIY